MIIDENDSTSEKVEQLILEEWQTRWTKNEKGELFRRLDPRVGKIIVYSTETVQKR